MKSHGLTYSTPRSICYTCLCFHLVVLLFVVGSTISSLAAALWTGWHTKEGLEGNKQWTERRNPQAPLPPLSMGPLCLACVDAES
jgi:hypothetical protein